MDPDGIDLESRILFEADEILAVDKCPDLPTSGRSLDDQDCLQYRLIQRHGHMVWAVHQLDADTSGVNLFTTAKRLVEPLKRGMAEEGSLKSYLAVVHGEPAWDSHDCTAPIGSIRPGELGVTQEGKSARSGFQVLARAPGFAAIRAEISTGRTHQIRIHLSSLGHPLVGEEWYREEPCQLHPRQALHAERLRVEAPLPLDLRARIPGDLRELLGHLGLELRSDA
ncbi:MAG: 23S rRNA-/tRNA-specific pseudouridylate synthase [Planctomycetota bacterium]|jgi:23S rRNA-/tRNA-specific pseudouridylate synthase